MGRDSEGDKLQDDDKKEEGSSSNQPTILNIYMYVRHIIISKRMSTTRYPEESEAVLHNLHVYKKNVTGKELEDDKVQLELEAAEAAWPNFKIFYSKLQGPTLPLHDQAQWKILQHFPPPPLDPSGEVELESEPFSADGSSCCQSRASTTGYDSGENKEDYSLSLSDPLSNSLFKSSP